MECLFLYRGLTFLLEKKQINHSVITLTSIPLPLYLHKCIKDRRGRSTAEDELCLFSQEDKITCRIYSSKTGFIPLLQ